MWAIKMLNKLKIMHWLMGPASALDLGITSSTMMGSSGSGSGASPAVFSLPSEVSVIDDTSLQTLRYTLQLSCVRHVGWK